MRASTKKSLRAGKNRHPMKSVIFLENEEQVRDYFEQRKEIKGRRTIVALSPFAMYELERKKISYKIPEDYYIPEELFKVGKVIHKRVEKFCDFVDNTLHQELPELKAAGLCPAKYHIVQLIMIFDTLASKIFQLRRILDHERPDAVFAFSSNSYPYGSYGFCFDNRELLYGKLLSLPNWGVPITITSTPSHEGPKNIRNKTYQLGERLYKFLASEPNLFYALDALQHRKFKEAILRFKKSLMTKNKKNVLLLNLGYDSGECYETFLNRGIFMSYFADKSFLWTRGKKLGSDVMLKIMNRLKSDARSFFVYDGIDLYPLIRDRIQFLITHGVLACLAAHEEASKVIKARKIRAILAPYFITPTSHSIAQAARNLGVPVLTWFHGVPISDHATIHYMELMSSNICMSYGKMLSKSYLRHAKEWNVKVVPVGSARLDRIKKVAKMLKNTMPESNNSKRLLYGTTHYYQNDFNFCTFPPPSDNMLYRTQLKILEGISELDNVEVTVKLFPGSHYRDPPLIEYAKTRSYKAIKWVKNVPTFVDLLNHCDLVVLDFPSTPLVEAIAAGKPIFLLTKYLKIWPHALKLLERRVACFEQEDELLNSLKNYLQTGFYPADLSNEEFLKTYCTYLNDGKSCERAATEILKAIHQSEALSKKNKNIS